MCVVGHLALSLMWFRCPVLHALPMQLSFQTETPAFSEILSHFLFQTGWQVYTVESDIRFQMLIVESLDPDMRYRNFPISCNGYTVAKSVKCCRVSLPLIQSYLYKHYKDSRQPLIQLQQCLVTLYAFCFLLLQGVLYLSSSHSVVQS